MKESVLYFALLPSEASSEELCEMIKLILKHANEINEGKKLINLVTIDNQTSLARALCHPKVTSEIIESLLGGIGEIDEKQLYIAFDMLARHYKQPTESFKYLEPLLGQLRKEKRKNYRSILYQLLQIICRHNNLLLLQWYTKINEV